MAEPSTDRHKRILEVPLKAGGKLSTEQIMRLAYAFASAVPIKHAAASQGVSQKTAREFYYACRTHLKAPAFRRWHSLSLINPNLPDDVFNQAVPKIAIFDVLAECYRNDTCYRNYRLGNRQNRFCRACPIKRRVSGRLSEIEAVGVVDGVHDFYRLLGLRKEVDADPVANFRDRLLHAAIIKELHDKSEKRADGTLDPADMSYEGVGSFLLLLMDELAEPSEKPEANTPQQNAEQTRSDDTKGQKPVYEPELVDWLLDDGTVIWLPIGEKPTRE